MIDYYVVVRIGKIKSLQPCAVVCLASNCGVPQHI